MKTMTKYRNENDLLIHVTEYGEFTKYVSDRGASAHTHKVEKLSGEWPSNDELMQFCDSRANVVFSARVVGIWDNRAEVVCHVN